MALQLRQKAEQDLRVYDASLLAQKFKPTFSCNWLEFHYANKINAASCIAVKAHPGASMAFDLAKFIQRLHETSTETNVREQNVTARVGILKADEM